MEAFKEHGVIPDVLDHEPHQILQVNLFEYIELCWFIG